jgi:hypothetical protein
MSEREIVICTKFSSDKLRVLARKESNRRTAMRMLAIANELDGYDREEAARLAGMSDQALRDAIKRLNTEGIDGLSMTGHGQAARAGSMPSKSKRSSPLCSTAPILRTMGSPPSRSMTSAK